MDNSTAPSARRFAKRNVSVVMTTVTIGAFVAVGMFLWLLELDPQVSIPAAPAAPSPNAFDDFQRAGNLLRDQAVVDAPRSSGVSAIAMLTPSARDQVLRDNAPALLALRQGLTHEYVSPADRSFPTPLLYLTLYRKIARRLSFERDVHVSHGEWSAAMSTSLDGIQMGSDIHRGGGLLPMMVGGAVEAISRDRGQHIVDHLSLAEPQAALGRIRGINSNRVTFARTLREYEWDTQASMVTLFHQPDWRARLTANPWLNNGVSPSFWRRLRINTTSKRRVFFDYTRYMDGVVADARARRPIAPYVPSASDPIAEAEILDFSAVQQQFNAGRTQGDFLELQLALRAYRLRHGSYPEMLQALSPAFEPIIPDDQFAPGKPLHYQPRGGSYLLYSIGPDGVDDGGKAIYDPHWPAGRSRRTVQIGSKGDIVAGVNF